MKYNKATVGIGVSCFNRLDNVKHILGRLRKLEITRDFCVVFASDGCTDGTQDYLRNQKDIVSLISKNKGVGANKGRLLKILKGFQYIFIFEDDIVPIKRGFIQNAISICTKTKLKHLSYGVTAKYKEYKFEEVPVYGAGALNGQVLFITKEVLEKVGYFNPIFGKYGYEHVEWSHRICRSGMYIWGPLYTFYEPHKFFEPLPEKGGMPLKTKRHWITVENKGLYRKLVLAKRAKIFIPEPKRDFEIINFEEIRFAMSKENNTGNEKKNDTGNEMRKGGKISYRYSTE